MPIQAFKQYEKALDALYAYIHSNIGMSRERFNSLSGFFLIRQFKRKTMVVKPGEVDEYFNFIVRGVVRKYIFSGKKEVTLQLSTEGHFIHAESSFFTKAPADCFIEPIEPTVFFSIHYDDLERLYTEIPELNKLARLMIGEMYVKKEMRDLSFLRLSAKERFLQYVTRHPEMLQRVSQKYLASYLHIKPETFSRLKHLLQQKKGN
ncbi:Crp/Fnr family transcriptional regulator [Flavihumibacter profundi]|jgi:CRP-like cAMP-binding protein|uniref:Crp/Fnr family transcriptional regulator n=1 Tax=Flavihumibacter profundi TaxID=2716883 RepID=UPI001CC36E19|nr:Crp/Fnr family transcriptional regulator [Flavihumibacter profundi]MBZ5856517.1 Crp/Fnr family transcriptional regulator [Flavihumibacter profundi]